MNFSVAQVSMEEGGRDGRELYRGESRRMVGMVEENRIGEIL